MPVEQAPLKVSVIIPTYNRAEYLGEALASVLGQSMGPWEVIVVDDGSTDNTLQVIQDAAGPVRVFQQSHRGVAQARNLGLEKAGGELIAWLDSDDLWEPDFLATVVPLLAQDATLAGVYSGITLIDARGTTLGTSLRVEPPDELYDALIRANFLATPSVVAWKRCYDQTGGFDPQLRISEDYDMWLQLARQFRIVGVPRSLVRIRIHTTNTMSDVDTACQARLRLAEKHFGSLDDNSTELPERRIAYGYAFRSIALKYVEAGQPTTGWTYLAKGAALHPPILQRLETFYELACGDQPRGYRGRAAELDLATNGAEMLSRLDALFIGASRDVECLRGAAYGNAHLALAMLADHAGDWTAARRYLLRAIRFHPGFLRDPLVVRRWVKLLLGQRAVRRLRRLRPESAGRAAK